MPKVLYATWTEQGLWEVRVDRPHLAVGKRHVHLRRRRKRNGEYSWNVDGTRHDKHRFPYSEDMLASAKEIAASHLGIPASSLELISTTPPLGRIVIVDASESPVITVLTVESDSAIFSMDRWIIVVSLDD
jgi:hypothetical protein